MKLSVTLRVTIVTLSSWGSVPPVSYTLTPQRDEREAPVIKLKLQQVVVVILLTSAAAVCKDWQKQGHFVTNFYIAGDTVITSSILALLNQLLVECVHVSRTHDCSTYHELTDS